MTNRELLQAQADGCSSLDHDPDVCGTCAYRQLFGIVAAEMLREIEIGEPDFAEWAARIDARWKDSKFVKLWTEESSAGRDPRAAFEKRGWEKA
jgi:hypothetical protein